MWFVVNNYLKPLAMALGYNMLYIFSYLEIKFNHLYNTLFPKITYRNTLIVESFDGDTTKMISNATFRDLYDKFGVSIFISNDKVNQYDKIQYDCMIIAKNGEMYPQKYIIITKDTGIHPYIHNQTHLKFPQELKWNNVKYKFISLVIVVADVDKTYDINLCNETENYYIAGNVIDKNFVKYYLVKYYNYKLNKTDLYMWQLIDQNVKLHTHTMNKKIILLEDNYEII